MSAELEATVRLERVVVRLARHAEVALAEVDLSASQYRTLGFLAGGPANASILADRLAIQRPSLTAVVDALVARGFVERRNDPDDRRRVGHQLTNSGVLALEQADAAIARRLDALLSLVDAEEAASATHGLAAWLKALDAFRAVRRTTNP